MSGEQVPRGRGQSSALAVVVLFGIVLAVSVVVVVAGTTALEQSQRSSSMEQASLTMSELDDQVSQLGPAARSSTSVSFADLSEDGRLRVTDEGEVRIVVTDRGSGTDVVDERITMGSVVYERDGETLAYQGGGVWRAGTGGTESTMVSPPDFDYRTESSDPTLSFPVLAVEGSAGDGSVQVRQTDDPRTVFPAGANAMNPLDEDTAVEITVESRYYRAWGRMFESRSNGSVSYDHDRQTVTLQLQGRTVAPDVDGVVSAPIVTRSATDLTNDVQIDSFDSSTGSYSGWPDRTNGHVLVDDDLSINSQPGGAGDLVVTGRLSLDNQPEIYGDTTTGGTPGDGEADEVVNSAILHGNFSTTDDLVIDDSSSATFEKDLIVGGDLQAFGPKVVQGDVHVGGTARLDKSNPDTDVEGNVTVGEDVYLDGAIGDIGGADGRLVAGGDVYVTDGSHDVDVVAGGSVEVEQNAEIDGKVIAGEDVRVLSDGSGHDWWNCRGGYWGYGGTCTAPGGVITGDVDAGRDVHVDGGIEGHVVAGGEIDGNYYAGANPTWEEHGSPTPPPLESPVTPTEPEVTVPDPVTSAIEEKGAQLSVNNDNSGAPIDDVESYDECRPECTLEAGKYYLDRVKIENTGNSLELDTSGGDIELYVDEEVHVKQEVRVTGDNQVRIYNNGDLIMDDGNGHVWAANDNATKLQVYMRHDKRVSFAGGGPVFTGVVYGPGPEGGSGVDVSLNGDTTVYGAVIGDVTNFNSGAEIHFDESLRTITNENSGASATADELVYLRLSEREVVLED